MLCQKPTALIFEKLFKPGLQRVSCECCRPGQKFSKVTLLLNVLCKFITGLAFGEFYLGPQRVSCECERCSFVKQSFVLSLENCKFVLKRPLLHLCVYKLWVFIHTYIFMWMNIRRYCVYIYIRIFQNVYICTCICLFWSARTSTCVCVCDLYIYTYTCIYVYT